MASKRDRLLLFRVFFCLVVCLFVPVNSQVLCEEGFCREYGFDVGCTAPVVHCGINNATHSGMWLPSSTICNCCDFCLSFIMEGNECSLGGSGDGSRIGRCGPGLSCTREDDGNFCRRMDSDCHRQQDEYDERHSRGAVGLLEERPRCDHKAKFAATVCVPTQTCFCQSETGERLFGEALYRDSNTPLTMQCGCSRMNHKIEELVGGGVRLPVIGPRCTADGNFNPVQCVDRLCRCVNTVSGEVETTHVVGLDNEPISTLPCYNADLELFPELIPEDETEMYNYTTPCYEERDEQMQRILESEDDGYVVDYFSSTIQCLPDGTYSRVAIDAERRKTCQTEKGERLGNYSAEVGEPGYDEMVCKCALTTHLMRASNELPVCCQNGNFRPVQCRRGACYCVDSDGRQLGQESSDVTSLPCFTEDWRFC